MKKIKKALPALLLSLGYMGLAFACRSQACVFLILAGLSAAALLNNKKNRFIGVISDLLILAFVLPMGASVVLYEASFFRRETTPEALQQKLPETIHMVASPFASNFGQQLCGRLYYYGDEVPDTVVLISHGNGVGQKGYTSIIDFFAVNNYAVFAYDATGYDESQGFTTRGLPQGIIDLDYAIRHVQQDPLTAGKSIVLFGHSWGAYSTCAVLNIHPDVEAVIALAGFDHSLQMIEARGRQLVGDVITVLLPYFCLYERVKFGEYATYTALDGFANCSARIMIVHSTDDATVPIQDGLALYQSRYNDNPRFLFVQYSDKGHEGLFAMSEAQQYLVFLRNQT